MSARAIGRRLTLATLASSAVCIMTVGAAGAAGMVSEEEPDEQPSADVMMREFDPANFSAQAADLPPGLDEAIQRDLDMSAEQYLASAAAAKVATKVVTSLGDTVRAAWLDGQTLNISVNDRSERAAAAATGAEVHVGDALADGVEAARSQGRIAFADRRSDEVVPIEADIVGEPLRTNTLSAMTESSTSTGTRSLRAGYGYAIEDLDAQYSCSAAFSGTTADGDPQSLTAGHCTQAGSENLSGPINLLGLSSADDADQEDPADGTDDSHEHSHEDDGSLVGDLTDGLLGSEDDAEDDGEDETDETEDQPDDSGEFALDDAEFGDGHDAALLDVTSSAWDLRPSVAAPAGEEKQGEPVPVYDSIEAVVGAPACKTGITSGWTCGKILDAESTIPVSGKDVTGFMIDACTLPGDGGGPVMVGNYALGVSSGSTWTGTECTEDTDAEDFPVAVGYALSGGNKTVAGLYDDDWNLSILVGAPEVTAPGDGDVTSQEPTFRGRINASAGATVAVTIDDNEPVEAEVEPDGTWSAPITRSLSPGTHSYTVTARHTADPARQPTASEPLTGSFDVAKVATLAVHTPAQGETTDVTQPRFFGTGDPGARITLEFDDSTTTATVDDDGTWTVSPDESERAGRFDATVTQETEDGTGEVSVEKIGIVPGAPMISPPDGDVDTGYVITGSALPESTVAVRVQSDETADSEAVDAETDDSENAERGGESTGEHITVADVDGKWEIDSTNLSPGQYTVSAVQAIDDLKSERSATVQLDVTDPPSGHSRAAEDEDDLVDTGSAPLMPLLAGVAMLGLGGVALFATRRRALPRR